MAIHEKIRFSVLKLNDLMGGRNPSVAQKQRRAADMPTLKAEPPGPVLSLNEFFSLAHAIESDAVARYAEAATLLRQQGADKVASVFERLAETERGHVEQVDAWAKHSDAASPATTALPWAIPDTHDATPGEMARSKLLTPYRVLASAVRHEQRAFAFWTYVSAHADKQDVKEAAERMALEELEHVSILRRERRKAFHSEQQETAPLNRLTALNSLATLERRLAEYIQQNPAAATGGDFASKIEADAYRAADTLESVASHDHSLLSLPTIASDKLADPMAVSEYLVDAYLRIAEVSAEPGMLSLSQELASTAVYRLAMLKSITRGDEDG
jgi:rubrerythrin